MEPNQVQRLHSAPGSPHPASGSELKRVLDAERAGWSFILMRPEAGELELVSLTDACPRVTVGRRLTNDVPLPFDHEVSRIHAELERIGGEWTVCDDGLSTNGTFVNGSRIGARRRLSDGDTLRFGQTLIVFRSPKAGSSACTSPAQERPTVESLSPTQRRVLIALCRPYKHEHGFASPATNQQIAHEVFLSVDAVKTHLRGLFHKFKIGDVPQNQKRLRLVEYAFLWGVVSPRDL